MTYLAHFLPQAWQNDYANEVDPEGPTTWDVTAHMEKLTEAQRDAVLAQDAEPWDYNDHLKGMPGAPEWVRDWSGPFEITVTEVPT